jgi:hypothetical protein
VAHFGVIAEASYEECGGTCPNGIQRFTEEASHGLGWTSVFEGNDGLVRGGHYAYGPLAGVFSALGYIEGGSTFRCVKAPTP